jgi:transaldolase
MPEKTLNAFAEHGTVSASSPARYKDVFPKYAEAGIDIDDLAAQLQVEGAASFVESWTDLISSIEARGETLKAA